jgi:hypothetical protein
MILDRELLSAYIKRHIFVTAGTAMIAATTILFNLLSKNRLQYSNFAISSGFNGYPNKNAARVAIDDVLKNLISNNNSS